MLCQQCEFCGEKFSASSLKIHQQKCKSRPELMAEAAAIAELAKIEGPRPLDHVADWEQCPNCGERERRPAAARVSVCVTRMPLLLLATAAGWLRPVRRRARVRVHAWVRAWPAGSRVRVSAGHSERA